MANIALALQRAVFAALRGSSDLQTLCEGRVFDAVPQPYAEETEAQYLKRIRFPYITIGDDQIIDDGNSCAPAWECFVNVHVWSREVGRPQAKAVGAAVMEALDVALTIDGFVVKDHQFRDAQYPRDTDGVTTHGILQFRYLIDEA